MKKIFLVLVIIMALGIMLLPKGVAKAATIITTCEQLQDMNLNLSEDYLLGSDIDCSATTGWNAGAGFEPVGNSGTPFTGTLDGQNHKVAGLFINRPAEQSVGLFGETINTSVSNMYLTNVSIVGNTYTGGLIGLANGSIQLNSVHVSGTVTGNNGAGGLLGALYSYDGNEVSNIVQSSNTATINGNVTAGGLIGDTGGGANTLLISRSFNSGNVNSSAYFVGGIIGYSQYGDNGTTLLNSYNTGNVTGASTRVGGLFGYADNTIVTNSYSSGLVNGGDALTTGALIGEWVNLLNMTNTLWNTQTSGQSTPCGTNFPCTEEATGITSAQMRTQSIFTSASWDFVDVWGICESFNNGFPYLLWQAPSCPVTPGLPNTGFKDTAVDAIQAWVEKNLIKY